MKFIHLSDLHIGKRLNELSLINDQEYILNQIIKIIDENTPQAVVIAGDVYDKAVPSAEAVVLFNSFLEKLSSRNLSVFIISGNHDSAERLSFGNKILSKNNIFISPVYNGKVSKVTLNDEFGDVCFYLLPFVKPSNVRPFFEEKIDSYNDAVKVVIDKLDIDTTKRNVLITHQFVTGATTCDSEEISVGGTENIDYHIFDKFDYVALGHIHSPQFVGKDTVRYCGTMLKYSFSEINNNNSVTIVDFQEKNDIKLEFIPVKPKHEMVEIKGSYNEVTNKAFYKNLNNETDYFRIILTDEQDVLDALGKLRTIYHNILRLDYDNKRTRENKTILVDENAKEKTPYELFSDFYEKQNNEKLNETQEKYIKQLISKEEEEQN